MKLLWTVPALALASLAACSSTPAPLSSTLGTTVEQRAVVTDVRDLAVNSGQNATPGAMAGGVLGGVAGSTIGGGAGRTLATIGGALAGGMAGQELGRASSTKHITRLTLRLDNGTTMNYDVEPGERFQVGDQVRVITTNNQTTVTH